MPPSSIIIISTSIFLWLGGMEETVYWSHSVEQCFAYTRLFVSVEISTRDTSVSRQRQKWLLSFFHLFIPTPNPVLFPYRPETQLTLILHLALIFFSCTLDLSYPSCHFCCHRLLTWILSLSSLSRKIHERQWSSPVRISIGSPSTRLCKPRDVVWCINLLFSFFMLKGNIQVDKCFLKKEKGESPNK